MHIGIDETGNFTDAPGYIVAVLARPSDVAEIERRLKKWEKTVRVEYGLTHEVKGTNLPPEGLLSFVDEVLSSLEPELFLKVFVVCSDGTNEQPVSEHCELQRTITMEQLEAGSRMYKKRDGGESRMANQYLNLRDWYKKLNYNLILQISILGYVITESLRNSIGFSVVHDFDSELGNLEFFIDRSFISKASVTIDYWKDILRSHLWQNTSEAPLPFVSEWKASHPFLRNFVENEEEERVKLKPELKKRINFYDSSQTPIIRIADICASIVRKRDQSIKHQAAFQKLKHFMVKQKISKLGWTTKRSKVPSPYK